MKKHRFFLPLVVLLLFAVAFSYEYHLEHKNRPERHAGTMEYFLHQQEREVVSLFGQPENLIGRLVNPQTKEDFKWVAAQAEKPYYLYAFRNDTLAGWTHNEAEIPGKLLNAIDSISGPVLYQLSNGYYEIRHAEAGKGGKNWQLIAAVPVKHQYAINSGYLRNEFPAPVNIPGHVRISREPENGYPVSTVEGKPLFELQSDEEGYSPEHQAVLLLLYLLAFGSLAVLINRVSNFLAARYHAWVGAGFLVFAILSLRYLASVNGFTGRFSGLEVFSKTFGGSGLYGSLGEVFIDSILLLWIMVFFHREFRIPKSFRSTFPIRFVFTTLGFLSIALGLFFVVLVFKTMVIRSGLTFDFENVLNLNLHSFLIILTAILLLATLFLFSHRIVLTISYIGLSRYLRLLASLMAIGITLPLVVNIDLGISTLQFVLIALIYHSLFDLYTDNQQPGLTWLVVWIFLFSTFTAALFYKYTLDKDRDMRLQYARSLLESRDTLAEYSIHQLGRRLMAEDSLRKHFTTPIPFTVEEKQIRDRIDRFIAGFFYLFYYYNYDVFVFNPEYDKSLISTHSRDLVTWIKEEKRLASPASYRNIFYWPESKRTYSYLLHLDIPLPGNPNMKNQVLIAFKENRSGFSRVYAELLKNSTSQKPGRTTDYDFLIMRDGRQVAQRGYAQKNIPGQEELPPTGEWKEIRNSLRTELIFHSQNGTVVIIGKNLGGYFKPLSLFSYIFALFTLMTVFLFLVNHIVKALPETADLSIMGKPSLRNRIQLSVVALILGSFVLIGLITVAFFRNSSVEYQQTKLNNKINSVLRDIDKEMQAFGQSVRTTDLKSITGTLADIHDIDINIYSASGQLIVSSAAYLFNQGIIGPQMDAVAFNNLARLKAESFVGDEQAGQLDYTAAYVPLENPATKGIIGYMELPFHSKDRNLGNDLYGFMGALLNVYVFLLLFAAGIAIAVANSITNPIAKIGEKLRNLKLGQNEPLEWNSQDELGELIGEYNRMIEKLEKNTKQLRQSEREGAWREMAKQVAHEIKNPLTPMKLNIQYLMHAYRSDPERVKPMLERISKTLIEQIDGLSRIASEFSNFAKMPEADNKAFAVNELVASVCRLFQENPTQKVDIEMQIPDHQLSVFADREHLMRVLNNIIKNAIQAIPEERPGKVVVSLYRQENKAVIQISDNGSGIPNEMKEKVFSPNFTTKTSGTGLGLAISKNIIEAVDGRIYFKTEAGQGTDFFVELPLNFRENSLLGG